MIGCKTAKFGMKWRKKCFSKYESNSIISVKMLGYIEGKQIILPIDQFIWNKFWSYYEYNGKTQTWRLAGFFGTGISWDIYFGNNLGKFEKRKRTNLAVNGVIWNSPALCVMKLSLQQAWVMSSSKSFHTFTWCQFLFQDVMYVAFFGNFELVFWKFEEITYGLMMSTGHCPAKLQTLWTKCT